MKTKQIRNRLLPLLALLLLLLSACTDNRIACGIDREHNAYLQYGLQIDTAGLDGETVAALRKGLSRLRDHYQALGFSSEDNLNTHDTLLRMDLTLLRAADTDAEAMEELKTLLEDEQRSLFSQVRLDWTQGELTGDFRGTLTVDLSQLLETAELDTLPQPLRDRLTQALSSASFSLSLTLPGAEATSEDPAVELESGLVSKTVPLSLDGPTTLSLSTRATRENAPGEKYAAALAQRSGRFFLAGGIAGGLGLGLLLLGLVLSRKKNSS